MKPFTFRTDTDEMSEADLYEELQLTYDTLRREHPEESSKLSEFIGYIEEISYQLGTYA